MSKIGNFIRGISGGVKSSVAAPVGEAVREEVNNTVESLFGQNPKPVQQSQQQQQSSSNDQTKKLQDQTRRQNIIQFLDRYKQQDLYIKQQRTQEENQKKQAQNQEEEQKKQIKKYELIQKKQQSQAVFNAQRKSEIKKGGA